jgi:hypothetical protein
MIVSTIDDTKAASRDLIQRAIDELALIPDGPQSHQDHGEAQTAIGELRVVLKALNELQFSLSVKADLRQIAVRLAAVGNPHTYGARDKIEAACTLLHRPGTVGPEA